MATLTHPRSTVSPRHILCLAKFSIALAVFSSATCCVESTSAQDSVYQIRKGRNPSRIIGTIEKVTPFEVTITTNSGEKVIPASKVARIVVEQQPSPVSRARERFDDGRFADSLTELDKLTSKLPSKLLQQEAAFLKAAANAEIALQGGEVTAQEAGTQVNQFLKQYPQSHLKFPATELLGKLLFAFGRLDPAGKSFLELTQSKWPEYEMRGHYYHGRTKMAQDDFRSAIESYNAILSVNKNGESTQRWQLLAACQKARCQAMLGDFETGMATLKKIIKDENPDNADLFATAFNALGACYLKRNQIQEARTEFLKTELLYPTATEPHAEALFNLTKIWAQLEDTDRANRARATLKSRYRNSWWTSQL